MRKFMNDFKTIIEMYHNPTYNIVQRELRTIAKFLLDVELDEADGLLPADEEKAFQEKRKLLMVKLYRDRTGKSLLDSKKAVEKILIDRIGYPSWHLVPNTEYTDLVNQNMTTTNHNDGDRCVITKILEIDHEDSYCPVLVEFYNEKRDRSDSYWLTDNEIEAIRNQMKCPGRST